MTYKVPYPSGATVPTSALSVGDLFLHTPLPFYIDGTISTGATPGQLALRFASSLGLSAVTLHAGSLGELQVAQ